MTDKKYLIGARPYPYLLDTLRENLNRDYIAELVVAFLKDNPGKELELLDQLFELTPPETEIPNMIEAINDIVFDIEDKWDK